MRELRDGYRILFDRPRDHLGGAGGDAKIILKYISKKEDI
jgi:hypothetical protein